MIAEAEHVRRGLEAVYGGRGRGLHGLPRRARPHGDRVVVRPEDEYGLLDLARSCAPRAGHTGLRCGPEAMLKAVEAAVRRLAGGQPARRALRRPSRSSAPEASDFEVVLPRSGLTLTVPPDRSILEVVKEAGVSVLVLVPEGVCGTCETEVVDGTPITATRC